MDESGIISRIREGLDKEFSKHHLDPRAWSVIEERAMNNRGSQSRPVVPRLVSGLAAAAVVVAVAITAVVLRDGQTRQPPSPSASTSALAAQVFHMHKGIWRLAVASDAIWVAGYNFTYRVDPVTGRTTASVPTPGTGADTSLAVGDGGIWVTEGGDGSQAAGVYRIDTASNRVAKFIPLPGVINSAVVVDYGWVWLTSDSGGGVLYRINPTTDKVTGAPVNIGPGAWTIVPFDNGMWVSSYFGNGSVKFVNSVGQIERRPIATAVNVGAAGDGWLWAAGPNGVERVNPSTGHVDATVRISLLTQVVFTDGSVWALTSPPSSSATSYLPKNGSSGKVYRIDPATDKVIGSGVSYGITPAAMNGNASGIWISDFTNENLIHVTVQS